MIEWNTIKWMDCLDKNEGLKSLPDKSVDLCLTDPPFNVKIKMDTQLSKNKLVYSDDMSKTDYETWCRTWFSELKRICNKILITVGNVNQRMWYLIEEPYDIAIHYKANSYGMCRIAYLNKFEPILAYGKFDKRFKMNVFNIPLENGFLQKRKYIHPCPKSYGLWFDILKQLKPKSVIDPFMGSGTTAEACKSLSIDYFGYEINPEYQIDYNLRMRKVVKTQKLKQIQFKGVV
jgi:DNA modification methylase